MSSGNELNPKECLKNYFLTDDDTRIFLDCVDQDQTAQNVHISIQIITDFFLYYAKESVFLANENTQFIYSVVKELTVVIIKVPVAAI